MVKAVLCKNWGDPSTLEVGEIERPAPGRGEVRISVRAAGVNPVPDNLMVAGLYQFKPSGLTRFCGGLSCLDLDQSIGSVPRLGARQVGAAVAS